MIVTPDIVSLVGFAVLVLISKVVTVTDAAI